MRSARWVLILSCALWIPFSGCGGGGGDQTGSISVQSAPAGASIQLDGADTGKTTPATLSGVAPGSHTVQLVLAGYKTWQQSCTVQAGQTTSVSATLEPAVQVQVTSVSPAADATDAPWTQLVGATFSDQVDESTLTTSSFRLAVQGGGAVSGSVSYDGATRTASFAPQAPLRPDTTYTATVTSAVTVQARQRLQSDYVWSFTTRPVTQLALHTSGNQILDSQGAPIVFHGVNMQEVASLQMYEQHLDAEYFQEMADWGAKLVRVPVFNPAFKWFEQDEPGSYLRMLDWVVAWAAERGMYTFIDFHVCGWPPTGEWQVAWNDPNWGEIYQFTLQDLRDFWTAISAHFAGDTRVAFYDLFNEPVAGLPSGTDFSREAWLAWRDVAESLIDDIRSWDPNRVVLVGGLQWAYDVSFAATDPVRRDNVVYSIHVYPTSNWRLDYATAFGNVANTYPVLLGEGGFDPNTSDPNLYGTVDGFAIPLFDGFLQPRGIGWTAFCFSPTWRPPLLSDWYTPNEAGEFFRARMGS